MDEKEICRASLEEELGVRFLVGRTTGIWVFMNCCRGKGPHCGISALAANEKMKTDLIGTLVDFLALQLAASKKLKTLSLSKVAFSKIGGLHQQQDMQETVRLFRGAVKLVTRCVSTTDDGC